jgi:hypothetical protein
MSRTLLEGWRRYKNDPDARVRERFTRDAEKLRTAYNAALWAMEREFKKVNREVSTQIRGLRKEIDAEFGGMARIASRAIGPVLWWTTRREERRLAAGWTYEPPTILERTNWFGNV